MICNVCDIPVYYEEYGTGKPVLCIHGSCVDHRLMTGCLEPVFSQLKGYRRIYFDMPGMGKTPTSRQIKTGDDMLDFIYNFINTIIPDENFLIAGESFGGYMTLGLIQTMSDKIDGVLLICPQIKSWKVKETWNLPEKKFLWQSDDFNTENDPDIKSFMDFAVIATDEIYIGFKKNILSGLKLADYDFLFNYFDSTYNPDFEDGFKNIKFDKPSCILTGRQDNAAGYTCAYEILDNFPRATYVVLDGSGHNLQNDNIPVFNQLVKDWIWRIELNGGILK